MRALVILVALAVLVIWLRKSGIRPLDLINKIFKPKT